MITMVGEQYDLRQAEDEATMQLLLEPKYFQVYPQDALLHYFTRTAHCVPMYGATHFTWLDQDGCRSSVRAPDRSH